MGLIEALKQTTIAIRDWVENKLSSKVDVDGTIATATKVTNDGRGQSIVGTYIKAIASSRLKLKYTKGDGVNDSLALKTAPIWYGTTSGNASPVMVTTSTGDFSITEGNVLLIGSTGVISSNAFSIDGKAISANISQNLNAGLYLYVVKKDGSQLFLVRISGNVLTIGSASDTGVLKLSDATNSTLDVGGSTAATPKAVKETYDFANGKADPYSDATSTKKGIVQLSTSVTSTSTMTAATPSAVKVAYDLASTKANATHTHPSSDITTTIPLTIGGTGAITEDAACVNLDLTGVKGLTIKHKREDRYVLNAQTTQAVDITFGCTFASVPSLVVKYSYANQESDIGAISTYVKSTTTTGATIIIANNSTHQRGVRPIWMAVGVV